VTSDPPGIMAPPADMQPYPFLQLVTLTAAMDANTVLGGWTGDCTPTANPLVATVLMGTAADVARDRTCDARFDPKPPAGPFQFLDDFSLPFRSDAFDRSRTGTTVFVSDIGLGSATHEISFANATNIVSAGSGSLCPGVTAVVDAQDPVVGRLLLGYSSTSTLSCATLYPLGQAVQFFNVGTTTGKAIPFPGDSQAQLIALFGSSAVRRQSPTGTTDIPTSPVTERSCPRFLATTPTYLYVVLVEGTPGTSTEQCSGNRGLKRIRLSDNAVVGSAVFGTTPRNPVLTPDGLIIYVPDYAENVVHVVTTSGLAVTRSIPVPGGPTAVALTDDAAYLIVTLWDLDQVAMVDLADDQIVGTIDSRGRHPTAVFTAPNGVGVVLNFGDGATNTPASIATFRYVP
jgi:DNA-binding beta-propeller fold protein YncE